MPSWKKVIVSGSDTHLNNITASAGLQVDGNITGSITSTGSFGKLEVGSATIQIPDSGFLTMGSEEGMVKNTRFGSSAGQNLQSGGTQNVLIGDTTGTALTTGDKNVAMGVEALKTETGGQNNTAIGHRALKTLNQNSVGGNVALGHGAGEDLATGALNILIGYAPETQANDDTRSIVIGSEDTVGLGDNTTVIGGSSQTLVAFGGPALISGSLTSTGSFGHLMVGGGNFSSASLAGGGDSFSDGTAALVSGSITSTGSFGAVSINTSDLTGGGRENTFRVNGTAFFDSSIRVGDQTEVGTDGQFKNNNGAVSLFSSFAGFNVIEYGSGGAKIRGRVASGESYNGVQFVQGDVLFTSGSQKISGSLDSTASFGKLITADTVASIGGSTLTVEAASVVNQDLSSDASPTFAGLRSTGDVRVDGDVIANQLIVSSSVTHLTQSFSSGSTIFGDTADDKHVFTGSLEISGSGIQLMHGQSGSVGLTLSENKISGSATVSASFGRLDITPQHAGNTNGVAISALNGAFSVANTQLEHTANGGNMVIGSTSSGGLLHSSGKATIRRDSGLGITKGLYFNDNPQGAAISMDTAASLLFGNNPSSTSDVFERMKLTVSGALEFQTGSYGVSGSITSTGSFGRVEASTIAGNSPLTIDSELAKISGSATATASFGQIESAAQSVANKRLLKFNYGNVGDTGNFTALSVNAQGSLKIESPANNTNLEIALYSTEILKIYKNNASGNPGLQKSLHGSGDFVGISEGTRQNNKATFYLNYNSNSRQHGLGGDIDEKTTTLMGQNLYIKAHNDTFFGANATGSIGKIGVNVHPQSASAQFHVSASGNNATGSIFKVSADAADTFSITNKKISGSFDTTGSFGQLDLLTNGHLRINQGGRGDEGSGLNNPSGITLFQSTTFTGDLSSTANLFSRIYDDNRLVLQNHYNNNGGGIELRTMAGGSQTTAIAVKGSTAETTIHKGLTVEGSTTINNDLAVTGSATITGDLVVNGTTSTINTTNIRVADALAFFATGSAATNVDAGIVVQSGSVDLSGSAFYHDVSSERWSVAKQVGSDQTAITPGQFVTTVKISDLPTNLNANQTYTGSVEYGRGEMLVDSNGEIYIYT